MNAEIQPIIPLDLAGVVVAAHAAGLVEMEVLVFRGVVLVCLACVGALRGCRGSWTRSRNLPRSSLAHPRCTASPIIPIFLEFGMPIMESEL